VSAPKLQTLLVASFVLLHLAPGCERSSSTSEPEAQSPDVEAELVQDSAPEVIDSDWVASKLELPPPPKEKNWLEEIEKDPIQALKEMDPAALQPRRERAPEPRNVSGDSQPRTRPKRAYDADKPLRGWPPAVGQFYPDVVLEDQTGQITGISHYRGKVVLVEVVGLTCPACDALSGGNDPGKGRFRGIEPQPGLSSIDRYARAWARHFGLSRNRNEVVLIGDQRFISPASRRLIPGFHLIDQQGILRSITSNDPRHDDLYTALLPKLASLVEEGR
jgi:hypothetical protein